MIVNNPSPRSNMVASDRPYSQTNPSCLPGQKKDVPDSPQLGHQTTLPHYQAVEVTTHLGMRGFHHGLARPPSSVSSDRWQLALALVLDKQ